jgi:uncharacterized membrane protein HdeD (DUF308 family)
MSMNQPECERIERAVETSLSAHWRLCLIEGIVLVILGLVAVFMPPTLAVEFIFGWLFLISGTMSLIITLWRRTPGFGWSLFSALLGIVAGMLLLLSPTKVFSFTMILVVFFLMEGIASIMYAFDHQREQSGRWVWMLLSGIIDIMLAAAILFGLPGSAKWALALLVGVNLMFGGVALIGMALHARTSERDPAAT